MGGQPTLGGSGPRPLSDVLRSAAPLNERAAPSVDWARTRIAGMSHPDGRVGMTASPCRRNRDTVEVACVGRGPVARRSAHCRIVQSLIGCPSHIGSRSRPGGYCPCRPVEEHRHLFNPRRGLRSQRIVAAFEDAHHASIGEEDVCT